MALPLQGSTTYTTPPVLNDPDFHDLQPHEQAQVLGNLYPAFNGLTPQEQARIISGIQATYNPGKSNALSGFLNAFNATNNQEVPNTTGPNFNTPDIIPLSPNNPSSSFGGLQKNTPIQVSANHPLVNLLNQATPQRGNMPPNLQKGTLPSNAGQAFSVGPYPNLNAQIQVLGQKYDQLNQVANNPTLDSQTRQNAKAAKLQVQNIFHQLNQQAAKIPNRNTPNQQQNFVSTAQTTQQPNPWQQLKAGNVLHEGDMRQLFQSIQPRGNSTAEQRQANLLRLYAMQKLAENTLANANRAQNGDFMIQGVPVRPEDALYFAKQDIQHFLDTQTHLKPNELLVEGIANPQSPNVIRQSESENTPYVSPIQAQQMVKDGATKQMLQTQKISQYYTWGDVMRSSSINKNNIKSIPISTYENAAKLAKTLDEISRKVGKKVELESWIRLNTSTYHKTGEAVDFRGSQQYLYKTVYPVIRKTSEIYGIGKSTPGIYVGLHVDHGIDTKDTSRNHYKKDYQYQFTDNGKHPTTGKNGKWLKTLK